jgi:hypothetical protein
MKSSTKLDELDDRARENNIKTRAMPTSIERIRELKTGSKIQRDRGLKGYPRALSMLKEAIAIARADLDESTVAEDRSQWASELSDCYALVGGVERRWAGEFKGDESVSHLKASISAYDDGFKFESTAEYGIVDSYNRLNRLLVRLLLRPDALDAVDAIVLDPDIPRVNLRDEFEQTSDVIRRQIAGPRSDNYWTLADLALVEVLLSRSQPAAAYANFMALSPPDFAFSGALAGLRPLAELPIPSAQSLREAVALLEDRLKRLRS